MTALVWLLVSVIAWFLGTIAVYKIGGWMAGIVGTVLLSWLFWRELAMFTALVIMTILSAI